MRGAISKILLFIVKVCNRKLTSLYLPVSNTSDFSFFSTIANNECYHIKFLKILSLKSGGLLTF